MDRLSDRTESAYCYPLLLIRSASIGQSRSSPQDGQCTERSRFAGERTRSAERVISLTGLSSPTIAVLATHHGRPPRASGSANVPGDPAGRTASMLSPPAMGHRTPQVNPGAGQAPLHLAGAI